MKRIHESLQRALERHRLVFWYDAAGEWADAFNAFDAAGVTRLRVAGNEFGTKVRIVRDPDPAARFLVYIPSARPLNHADNWLLDLLYQGHEFRADRASLILEDVGLPHEYQRVVEEHIGFFSSGKRVRALRELLEKDDEIPGIRLKMMGVLAGTSPDTDPLLMHFLQAGAGGEAPGDPVVETLGAAALVEPFWRNVERLFGYTSQAPSLRDFAVSLFRGANPLDRQVPLHPHARVFLRRWQDSTQHREAFRTWSRQLQGELQIEAALTTGDEDAALGEWDTFELFEKFTLHRLCEQFAQGTPAATLREAVQERRGSFWYPEHRDGYAALEHALELRELLAAAELTMESVSEGVSRYQGGWWRIDRAYRRCVFHLRRYGQVQVMEPIAQWVERTYVNNFLLPLADRWSDRVAALHRWACEGLPSQRSFFDTYVQPFRARGQKVFVIVSDALRYEAAAEFAERLTQANRWTAEVEAVFASLPTYTQLGMASLLPGRERAVDADSATVMVDGRSASGTANRAEILRRACDGRGTALLAGDFLEMNTKTEGRALMRDHDVIYIFHDQIDDVGDKARTEGKTLEAVEKAFDELDHIIRKVANINGSNMLLTADHGFLFQQDEVATGDMRTLPPASEWTYRNRRFALGRGIAPAADIKIFAAQELGLAGDWSAAFPLSLGRFPLQGSGKRYVHGGISLQEVVIPVVRIRKTRADDTGRVEVELLRVPAKITTGQLSVALFQDRPAVDKILPRTLRVGVFAKDGSLLSEVKTLTFDSRETEARNRETGVLLALSHQADAHNNTDVELRLEETLAGTSQTVAYKTHSLRLQKPFTSDFDEF
jgi:uncharacterized protein (TIGR02687 family)